MRRFVHLAFPLFLIVSLFVQGAQAQILDPVTWSFSSEKVDEKTYALHFSASMEPGWYVYSQHIDEGGPIPTTFHFESADHYTLQGETTESGPARKEGFDEIFQMDVIKYGQEVQFTQVVVVGDPSLPIQGYLEFMTCDDTRCLPPTEEDFTFNLAGNTAGGPPALADGSEEATDTEALYAMDRPDLDEPVAELERGGEIVKTGSSIWEIFGLGFIGGLLALLTPCVFPLIPLTVSFFSKQEEGGGSPLAKASLYGFFIVLVYLLFSLPFHLMDSINPDILNDLSTNVWLNVAFFLIFLVFAFSFFGYFELTLPSSWVNRASAAEGIGGLVGIFFMALTLALVSFSCTGPILGSLLAGALTASGGAMQLTAGMAGFGLALALPFTLFAAFPSWLNTLPRSGGWLNTVKVTLGFLELALALKFLSNADLVQHWGVLKIELFLGLWMVIFVGLGLYLLGYIRFPHDTPPARLSPVRGGLGVLSFAFALYLASGFLYDSTTKGYRSLTLLSGLAPPVGYSFLHPNECPQNLNCYKDLNTGLAEAKRQGKPVMLDFTGYACVNCRKMEEHVWPESEVYQQLKADYVLISLYVDDKKPLPENEQVWVEKTSGGKRKLRTYGQKWAHFQTEYFRANAQPFYVLIHPDGKLLTPPVGYMPDARDFASFLATGRRAFRSLEADQPVMGMNEE